ncbi:MAG: GNAT family N-acetyltransferase [Actinomycetota bacterium]|nr:GNAT family N-acetyltransferase [Actinomycetota bacterium]
MRLTTSGDWPGPIVLQRGWARAEARPWNEEVPDAQLRLLRGGRQFLQACTSRILQDAPAIVSPPLSDPGRGPWSDVGYQPFLLLDLYRRRLSADLPEPEQEVKLGSPDDWGAALAVDQAAFRGLWRIDRAGLDEALRSTPRSALLLSPGPGNQVAGFAVVGSSGSLAYLQRMAVRPESQGRGVGRSLVRAALRWSRAAGSRAVFLNTQPDNTAAGRLYRSEGFVVLPDPLHVLRATRATRPLLERPASAPLGTDLW